jgi:ubiquinone/menaquinone biosynthesis C-methylase UbiE
MEQVFNSIYQEAIEKASFLQSWPGHFLAKEIETEIITRYFDFKNVKNLAGLEVGCGNAFQSALLANIFHKFVATDLFQENKCSHTIGIHKAKRMIDLLSIKNIHLISCSATTLPFTDNYFDFVFSSSVLEHIEERNLVLQEIKRVLKPKGYLILILPTHMPSIYAFPHVFLYILGRTWKLLFDTDNKDSQNNNRDSFNISLMKRFKRNHPSFPLPEPHGAYSNIFKELYQQFPARWMKLINTSGFKIIKSFPVCLIPWLLIEPFSTRWAAHLYSFTKRFHFKFGNLKLLKYCGYLIGFIAVKNS